MKGVCQRKRAENGSEQHSTLETGFTTGMPEATRVKQERGGEEKLMSIMSIMMIT